MELALERQQSPNSLRNYLAEIKAYKLLSAEEESKLARQLLGGNVEAGHSLVAANLRFVVKIARQYRSYGLALVDLIQEGNLGLMKAVQKFDPQRKVRLISYAVWWIRVYIQNYVLSNWSLVKLGTTQTQRKLFYSLARTRRQLERMGEDSERYDVQKVAQMLNVRPSAVGEMQQRMSGRDVSLEVPFGSDGDACATLGDFLVSPGELQDYEYAQKEEAGIMSTHVCHAISCLDSRERYIIQQRAMSEPRITLKRLGEHFGFSRERARQIEIRAKKKLRQELQQLRTLAA